MVSPKWGIPSYFFNYLCFDKYQNNLDEKVLMLMLPRPFAIKPWITCVLKDRYNHPLPKTHVKYTRLFFIDEVTAFAAGQVRSNA